MMKTDQANSSGKTGADNESKHQKPAEDSSSREVGCAMAHLAGHIRAFKDETKKNTGGTGDTSNIVGAKNKINPPVDSGEPSDLAPENARMMEAEIDVEAGSQVRAISQEGEEALEDENSIPIPVNTNPEGVEVMVIDFFSPDMTHGDSVSYVVSASLNNDSTELYETSKVDKSELEILQEIVSSENPPEVVNMSFGGRASTAFLDHYEDKMDEFARENNLDVDLDIDDWPNDLKSEFISQVSGYVDSLTAACQSAADEINKVLTELVERGVTVVYSAGNAAKADRILESLGIAVPAGFHEGSRSNLPEGVLVVGASESSAPDSAPADFTPTYNEVDFAMDGLRIVVNDAGDVASGTSLSAPQVTALVADMKALDPTLTPAEIERILKQTASNPNGASSLGAGVVNRDDALLMVRFGSYLGYPETVRYPAWVDQLAEGTPSV